MSISILNFLVHSVCAGTCSNRHCRVACRLLCEYTVWGILVQVIMPCSKYHWSTFAYMPNMRLIAVRLCPELCYCVYAMWTRVEYISTVENCVTNIDYLYTIADFYWISIFTWSGFGFLGLPRPLFSADPSGAFVSFSLSDILKWKMHKKHSRP